jgi:glycosyltransferase involved in cell wall biosynthesis
MPLIISKLLPGATAVAGTVLRTSFQRVALDSLPFGLGTQRPASTFDPLPSLLISVVIPTYNYGHLLPRALDSVLVQWADDIELLVVNDGSEDNTAEVLHGYVECYGARVQVIQQANQGAASARNCGIAAAQGRYVLLLDADDELLPKAFATLRQVLAANPRVAMVLGAQLSISANGNQRLRLPTPVQGSALQRCQRYLLDKTIAISHSRSLFRRDLLLQRPYPQTLRSGEDVPVFAYVLVSGAVATTSEPLARVHKHADSLRHNRDDEEAVAERMLREVFAHLPDSCQCLRQRYAAQRYLSLFRAAILSGDRAAAFGFFRQAFKLSPLHTLRPRYVSKLLRLGLGWR